MSIRLFLALLPILGACSLQHPSQYVLSYPDIPGPQFRETERANFKFAYADVDALTLVSEYSIGPAPTVWPTLVCGGTHIGYYSGNPRNQIVIRLDRVVETWVPISGQVERHYEFKVF